MATFEEKVEKQIEIIKQQTFLDPTRDKAFKKIFSKDVTLIHFLNAILHQPEERKIVSIERKKPASTLTSAIDSEEVRFDVHAKLNNNEFVDLEMQRASHEDFVDRVALYSDQLSIESKIHFDSQRTKTEKEDHPYLMPTTYSIWICNFQVSFCESYREELGLFRFSSIGDTDALPVFDKKKYIVVDLSKVDAKVLDLNTTEREWLEIFTRMASAKNAPKTKDPVIAEVYRSMMVNALEKSFIKEIATGMVTEAEISTRIGTARREGREEGREEGRKEGRDETKQGDAEALLRDGDSVERVVRVLKLPLEKVQELADKIAAEKAGK